MDHESDQARSSD